MALEWARRSFTALSQPASVAVALAISTQAVGIAAAAARFVGLDERLPVLPEEGRATRDCRKQQHDFGRLLSTTTYWSRRDASGEGGWVWVRGYPVTTHVPLACYLGAMGGGSSLKPRIRFYIGRPSPVARGSNNPLVWVDRVGGPWGGDLPQCLCGCVSRLLLSVDPSERLARSIGKFAFVEFTIYTSGRRDGRTHWCLTRGILRRLAGNLPRSLSEMPPTSARLSMREKAFVVATCTSIVAMTSNYAIMVTFFPIDMRARGMSGWFISTIFAAFEVGRLVAGTMGGVLASRFGRRAVLAAGMGLTSLSGCCMGLTPDVAPEANLIVMGMLFIIARFIQGCGVALAQVAIFAILSDAFPTRRGLVVGTATSMIAAGYFVGPPLGGLLYGIGSFRLPFLVLGMLVAAFIPFILTLYPRRRSLDDAADCGTQELRSADAAAGHGDVKVDVTSVSDSAAGGPIAKDMKPSGLASAVQWWLRHANQLPQDVWLVLCISLVYFSKWGWWDIWFTSWCTSELGFSLPTASISISFIAALFAIASPVSGWLGDRLKGGTRMILILACMPWFAVLHFLMGPWQAASWGLSVEARRVLFFVYLASDGLPAALVEAQFVPQLLMLAEAAASDGPNEHLTNFVTSLSQTFISLGQVLGPFAAVPIVEVWGFRGGLVAWGVAYLVVSTWGWWRIASRGCGAPKRPTERVAAQAEPAAAPL